MKGVRLFLVLSVAVVGLAYLIFSSAKSRREEIADPGKDLVVGEPIVFRNLSIFPVTSRKPRNEDRFTTLDEGLRAGTVEIVELGATTNGASSGADPFAVPDQAAASQRAEPVPPASAENSHVNELSAAGADPFAEPAAFVGDRQATANTPAAPVQANSVNQLMVVNRSNKPLYLMPGEVIVGGSQDRAIGQELVVAPDHKPVPLNVFCVEHGRWGGRAPEAYAAILPTASEIEPITGFAANLSLSITQTTEAANAGKFIGSIGSLNAHGRVAVQKDKDQSKVWDEVAQQNRKSMVESTTGAFAANYSASESGDRLAPFVDQLLEPIDARANIVGVIVAVNGHIESMDVFQSTPLFQKLWPKLLKSYALDAANDENSEKPAKSATRAQALSFLRETANANVGRVETNGDLAVSHRENERVLLFSAHQRQNGIIGSSGFGGAGMGGMGGGFGSAVHAAGFAK